MHADNPNRTCGACGNPVALGREARHPMGAGGDVFCLDCEHVHLSVDLEVAMATTEVLEMSMKAALNGHVSPEDLAATVARAISEMDTTPQETIEDLGDTLRRNRQRRTEG
jgi:hypothetical protein